VGWDALIDTMFIQCLINGLLLGGLYVLVTIGLSFAFGVMHLINTAQGEFVILGAFLALFMYEYFGINPLLIWPLSFIIFFFIGYVLQRVAVERLVGAPVLMNLVFFLGLSILIANLGLYIYGPWTRMVTTRISGASISIYGVTIPVIRLLVFCISMFSILALFIFLKKTRTGLAILATAQDKNAAAMAGIDVRKMHAITLGIGTGTAAMAGTLISQIVSFTPMAGPMYTLFAFFVTVLGGMGYLPGALVGGLLLGLMESFIATYWSPKAVYFIMFFVLYIILLIRPKGIFGRGL